MSQKVVVTVQEGKVRGFKTKSIYSDVEYYSFLGIPYGQSTAGQARYKDPVKVKPWNNILDATSEKKGCLQFSLKDKIITGTEDCLYNNIHTTEIDPEDGHLKAVIVNIHPGGYSHGSPDPSYYGSPEYIINHDVVYVCVGYRLHILGHLNLSLKNHCTGNQSLKDIILALKWIRDNIRVFGGDPENITILGSSSGSSLVHGLLLSPFAKGLYHKAILMGMYIFNPTLITCDEHITMAYENALKYGFEGKIEDKQKLLKYYKKADFAAFLLSKIHEFHHEKNLPVFPTSPYIPLGEPGDDSPVPLSPKELMPSTNQVPLMVGFCNREGAMGVAVLQKLKRSFAQWFHKTLTQNVWGWGAHLKDEELKEIQKKVEDFYLNGESLNTASKSTTCDILTDVALSDVYDTLINLVSSNPSSPVYVYNFTYDGKLCTLKSQLESILGVELDGAYHATDYCYWCYGENRVGKSPAQVRPQDRQMIDTMANLLTKFAKTGNPNNDHVQVNWKPSTPESPSYLNINETLEVKDELLNGKRMEFWHNLKKQFKKDCNINQ